MARRKFTKSPVLANADHSSFVIEWAKDDYESGHGCEDYREFSKYCLEEGIEPTEGLWNLYLENYQ